MKYRYYDGFISSVPVWVGWMCFIGIIRQGHQHPSTLIKFEGDRIAFASSFRINGDVLMRLIAPQSRMS